MPVLPILYSFRRCPYAMRARLALAVSGQSCELREVVLRAKPDELLQASPKGTVPVLVLPDGQVIEQSLDIMLWALEQNDPQSWMHAEAGGREEMLALVHSFDDEFKPLLDRYKYPQRYENVDAMGQRARGAAWLQRLEDRLAAVNTSGAPNKPEASSIAGLFGARACLADAAIMPFVRQFAHVDREWFYAEPWPAIHAWLTAWLKSPLFTAVMVKHEPWQGGQGPVFP